MSEYRVNTAATNRMVPACNEYSPMVQKILSKIPSKPLLYRASSRSKMPLDGGATSLNYHKGINTVMMSSC